MGQAKRNKAAGRVNTPTCDYDLSLDGRTAEYVLLANISGCRPPVRCCGRPATKRYENTTSHGMDVTPLCDKHFKVCVEHLKVMLQENLPNIEVVYRYE